MKTALPTPDLSTAGLFDLPHEIIKYLVVKTALELKIFDYLSTPKTAQELSQELSTDPVNTKHLLNTLTALGCTTKTGENFQNTPSAESCWKSTGETSLRESFLFMSSWGDPMLNGGMLELIKNGAPKENHEEKISNSEIWKNAAYASLNHTRCSRAQVMTKTVKELPEFPNFKKILDLGAGPGIIGIAITLAHPDTKCVLFDQPVVCDVAEEVIAEYSLQNRVTTLRGDYSQDDIGSGYDFIIASFTLNFFRNNLEPILRKVYSALNPGGVFMVSSDGMDASETAPLNTITSWLPTKLQGSDMSFIKGEIAAKMLQTGFTSTARHNLEQISLEAHGPIEITVGRK